MTESAQRVRLHASETIEPPRWAVSELELMQRIEDAAEEFVARYTRDDGSLIWRDRWPGMDGSDDPYEAFQYLALRAWTTEPGLSGVSQRLPAHLHQR